MAVLLGAFPHLLLALTSLGIPPGFGTQPVPN